MPVGCNFIRTSRQRILDNCRVEDGEWGLHNVEDLKLASTFDEPDRNNPGGQTRYDLSNRGAGPRRFPNIIPNYSVN